MQKLTRARNHTNCSPTLGPNLYCCRCYPHILIKLQATPTPYTKRGSPCRRSASPGAAPPSWICLPRTSPAPWRAAPCSCPLRWSISLIHTLNITSVQCNNHIVNVNMCVNLHVAALVDSMFLLPAHVHTSPCVYTNRHVTPAERGSNQQSLQGPLCSQGRP